MHNKNIKTLETWLKTNGFAKEAADLYNLTKLSVGPGVGMDPFGVTMPMGMKQSEYNQLEDADPEIAWLALQILDPTGILSVPDVPPAVAAFESNKSLFNGIMLILAVLAIIPVAGRLAKLGSKVLKGTSKALSKAKNVVPPNFGAKADEAIEIIKKVESDSLSGTTIPQTVPLPKDPRPLGKAVIEPPPGWDPVLRGRRVVKEVKPISGEANRVADFIGADAIRYAGEGMDAEVYIMKLLNPIGKHSEVAVKILSKGAAHGVGGNLEAARRVLRIRPTVSPSTAKYLPEVLEIGKVGNDGQKFIIMEKLNPLPEKVKNLFRDGVLAGGKHADNYADLLKTNIDEFAKFVKATTSNTLGRAIPSQLLDKLKDVSKNIGGVEFSEVYDLAIKYAYNPQSVPVKAKNLIDNIPANRFENLDNFDSASYEAISQRVSKGVAYAVASYSNKVRNKLLLAKDHLWATSRSAQHAKLYQRVLDDIKWLDNFDSFMKNNSRILSRYNLPDYPDMELVPSSIAKGQSYAAYGVSGGAANLDNPVVKNAFDAMNELADKGFTPHDMHVNNWLIRPDTGDLVMVDVGGFH